MALQQTCKRTSTRRKRSPPTVILPCPCRSMALLCSAGTLSLTFTELKLQLRQRKNRLWANPLCIQHLGKCLLVPPRGFCGPSSVRSCCACPADLPWPCFAAHAAEAADTRIPPSHAPMGLQWWMCGDMQGQHWHRLAQGRRKDGAC